MSRLVPNEDYSVFTFSLPLPAIAPLARDPNLQPLCTASDSKNVTASRLTTLNADVQNLIMSVLPTADLSALMRTCRYLSEAALLPLCARSFVRLNNRYKVASFHKFLRINSGPSTPTPFIKALWFDVPSRPHSNDDIQAYLGILRHCQQVRRLRLSWWYDDIHPAFLFHVIVTSLTGLEELDLTVRSNVSEKDLRKLARLPIRKLQISGDLKYGPDALSAIVPLGRTLVDLSINLRCLHAPPGGSFSGVRRLRFHCYHDASFVETLTTTFPGVTHLTISGYTARSYLLKEIVHERNRQVWQKDPTAWRTLQAVYAMEADGLYALGLVRRIAHLSVPFDHLLTLINNTMLAKTIADLCPAALELRVDLVSFSNMSPNEIGWGVSYQAMLQASPRLVLCLDGLRAKEYYCDRTMMFLDALENYLTNNSTLTHLLVRHVFNTEPSFSAKPDSARIPILAQASRTLRWIGFEVNGALQCWEVTHFEKEGSTGRDAQVTVLVNMSEAAGRRVLAAEKMDEFRQ
ncbi:hypothetical protein L226DRAFT_611124 [Lentinus tigrinus ALCF2SS1-7]|uniref:F-box domain-containing protein n=1 Tax=Lentinus tigrinus ALCF2SS1-6 TaxID=1328759 RepID=A0A5C2SG93_9APHY|nr:hypothetical protein L227DRAFT_651828 [Lentinus tigrinus ALCF2SS1-6]RPD77943.1 hypothetical protein L226DRAFT_611124 [Lentinus tigrinus ALCF2SS1-7]